MSKNKNLPGKLSKKEQRRQQMAKEKQMRTLRIVIPIAVLLLAFIAFIVYRAVQPEIEGVVSVASEPGGLHDATLQLDFGGLPPMGGPHQPQWQRCGIYEDAVVRPEFAVHSMEHGAVWVSYHPDLPAGQIARLQDIVAGQPEILLSPYPDQSEPIVLTVWDRQLTVEDVNDERIEQFIDRYRDRRGPEASANCVEGVGVPVQ